MKQPKIVRRTIGGKHKWIVDPFKAKRGDVIEWSSDKTDFEIWFPHDPNPLTGVQGERDKRRKVTRKVKKDAKLGIYQYSVLCYKDNTMAEGGTSPEMEVIT